MAIESRGIEFIPENERYGTARRLFTIWFSSNMQVTTMVVGTLGVVAGLNVGWTIVGLIIGNLFGTIFMAAHSAQGPHLGIPQMIQSRAQFGILGAALPLLIVVVAYILFTAANGVVMRDSIKSIYTMTDNTAIILFGVLSLIIGYVGYELIHKMGMWMSALSGLVFACAAVVAFRQPFAAHAFELSSHGFIFSAFMLVIVQSTSWTLGFAPYVADYSRYLPTHISHRSTFWYTYLGNALGSTLVMILGAVLAMGIADITKDPGTGIAALFGNFSRPALIIIVLGVLEINVLNVYSAYMSTVTIFTGLRGMSVIGNRGKLVIMTLVVIASTWIAIATQYRFNEYFSDILIAMIYVLVPWSSINLVDYYMIRKGQYSVKDMYLVDGIYGSINWTTLAIYFAAIAVQLPFMDLSFYHSYFARLTGADLSWIPSLIVPGVLYYMVNRKRGLHLVGVSA
jgi:NCS1 family nucleobase:cation symporter-1